MPKRSRVSRFLVPATVLAAMLASATPADAAEGIDPGAPSPTADLAPPEPAVPEVLGLLARHDELVARLAQLQTTGVVDPSLPPLAEPLSLPTGDRNRHELGLAETSVADLELRAIVEALLETQAQLAEANPGTAFGIGPAVFPVAGTYEFVNSWGQGRSGGRRHKGTDILAPEGAPLVAVESGHIERFSNNALGGLSFYFQGDSGARYYYAHLSAFGPQAEGEWVPVGTVIGYNGDSGNARGTPHLHFQYAPDGGEGWVNPYPLLMALRDAVWPGAPVPVSLVLSSLSSSLAPSPSSAAPG